MGKICILEVYTNQIKNEIIKALRNLYDSSNYDTITIIRGRGSGLEVFNSINIAEETIILKIPLITALKHESDELLLEKFADKRCLTPTDFGDYLYRIAAEYKRNNYYNKP